MLKQLKRLHTSVNTAFSALDYTVNDDRAIDRIHHLRDEFIVLGLVCSVFISAVLAAVVCVAIVVYLVRQDRLQRVIDAVAGSRVLLVFCLVTLTVSLVNKNGNGALMAFVMCAIFLVSMYIRTVMTRDLFEKITDVSCFASLAGFVAIVLQRLATLQAPAFRPASLFLNANYYGAVTELVILLCIYKIIQPKQKRKQLFGVLAVLNFAGLYLSNCRTAIAVLSAAILVILFFSKKYRELKIIAWIDTLVIALVYLQPSLIPRIDNAGMDFMYRISIWRTAMKGILAHPILGQGGGSYQLIFQKLGGPATEHAHSLFLDPLLNFGMVGVALLAVYYSKNIKPIRSMSRYPQDQPLFALMAAVLACVVIHGITDITVFSVQTGLLVSILMGVAGIRENQLAARPNWHQEGFQRGKSFI